MDEHSYFRAIEERFIELRGAPLLLSPADYQTAKRWYADGIPIPLIHRVLEELFARRAEKGADGPVQSLRYCASAVESAWKSAGEHARADRREEVAPLDAGSRLAALATAISERVPELEELAGEVAALSGSAEEIEQALSELDTRLLAAAGARLDAAARAAVEKRVERGLTALGSRLDDAGREAARSSLFGQALRRELGLPVLSLFTEI